MGSTIGSLKQQTSAACVARKVHDIRIEAIQSIDDVADLRRHGLPELDLVAVLAETNLMVDLANLAIQSQRAATTLGRAGEKQDGDLARSSTASGFELCLQIRRAFAKVRDLACPGAV
jgi:hypothetical protein